MSSGIAVTKVLGYTFIIAIAAPFGPALGLLFTDRIERKWVVDGRGAGHRGRRAGLHPGAWHGWRSSPAAWR